MKIFLDECVDWRLARGIAGHEVKTAQQMGWAAITNGALPALASREFDVFLTVDGILRSSKTCPRCRSRSSFCVPARIALPI